MVVFDLNMWGKENFNIKKRHRKRYSNKVTYDIEH